jgi:TonB family protein
LEFFAVSLDMIKTYLYILLLLAIRISAQSNENEGLIYGGKKQIDQVIETQFTIPKVLLTSNFDVNPTVFFDIDSAGNPVNITFEGVTNNVLRKETLRMLRFLRFRKTKNEEGLMYPYSFSYHMTTAKYNKLFKQRSKSPIKKSVPADSSYIIYTKADKSPEYYKNGEEGLKEYILSEIEYPKAAIEKSVEGTVVVEFVVETNGYITGITVLQGLGAGCSDVALRIIKETKWQPATLGGKLVRYKMSYPITFNLHNINKDASSTIGGY